MDIRKGKIARTKGFLGVGLRMVRALDDEFMVCYAASCRGISVLCETRLSANEFNEESLYWGVADFIPIRNDVDLLSYLKDGSRLKLIFEVNVIYYFTSIN